MLTFIIASLLFQNSLATAEQTFENVLILHYACAIITNIQRGISKFYQ